MKRKYRVYEKTMSIVKEEALEIFENLVGDKKGFLLESYDKNYDRFTFLGSEPEEIIRSMNNGLIIEKRDGKTEKRFGNPFEKLQEYFNEFEISKEENELPFQAGLVGSLGYDFIRYTEKIPDNNPDEIGIDTICMMFFTSFIVVDHLAGTLSAVILEEDSEAGKERASQKACQLTFEVRSLEGKEKTASDRGKTRKDGKIIRKSDSIEDYSQKVSKIKEYIKNGHIFQTVLSQRWTIETTQNGFDLYKDLRERNPSPYLYYFNFGDFELIGSSPEMLVKQQSDHVFTCPIAGSRKRGKNDAEDEQNTKDLLLDEKERAEHVMLVDLARNDMGKIAKFGSVKVTQFMGVKKFSHIMHIVSKVEGRRKKKYHPLDLAAAFLPAGTLSGAPKIRAMEIIDELETVKRGLYGGATGYIDFSGDMDLCITIRSMVKKKNKVYLQAGAGIVADSVPENEYTECCNKVMALAKTLLEEENL